MDDPGKDDQGAKKLMNNLTLILGGARSGKSAFALRLAEEINSVVYVATALPIDSEMKMRIERHRKSRPKEWRTMEVSENIAEVIRKIGKEANLIILDCWSLYLSKLLTSHQTDGNQNDVVYNQAEQLASQEVEKLIQAIENSSCKVIVVSNEVGWGLVPPYPFGRYFRDLVGLTNQRLAKEAGRMYFLIAGVPLEIKKSSDKLKT